MKELTPVPVRPPYKYLYKANRQAVIKIVVLVLQLITAGYCYIHYFALNTAL